MKKLIVTLIAILCCFAVFSALAEEDISVEKYSLFNIDYGENIHSKESYYVAYIKNNSNDPLYIDSFDLVLYGENGNKLGIVDHTPLDCASLYLLPQEVSCVSFLTHFGYDNYDKSAVSAELKCHCIKDDPGYLDVDLDSSNSYIKSWFDSSQYSMYATIKNKSIKDTDKQFYVNFVLEDQNGNPIYIDTCYFYSLPAVGKELNASKPFNINNWDSFNILKDYFSKNNITPIKVNSLCNYEAGEKYLTDDDYYAQFDMD